MLTTTETGGGNDTGTSVRLGIAFPFKDQEIEDDVYTRTYFDGKMEFNFDTATDGTSDFSNYDFITNLAAIDIFSPEDDEGAPVQFDWGVFDENLNNEKS